MKDMQKVILIPFNLRIKCEIEDYKPGYGYLDNIDIKFKENTLKESVRKKITEHFLHDTPIKAEISNGGHNESVTYKISRLNTSDKFEFTIVRQN